MKEYRPRLTEEEYNAVLKLRESKDMVSDSDTQTEGYESTEMTDTFKEYCERYGLDISKVKSYKFVNHQGQQAFNIVFHEGEEVEFNPSQVKKELEDWIDGRVRVDIKSKERTDKEGVLTITDLHFGAYVDNLIRSKPFSISVLANMLEQIVDKVNYYGYSKVHVHILGDLIESFTGMNHANTWKGLGKGMFGSQVVKLTTKILHENFLSKIYNLGQVKIIGANHDRVTTNNDEDVHGEAADIISWGLELMGYDVEFNPLVITHKVDGITHILLHGHHGLSKQTTEEICWKYGSKGSFNFIKEGHMHTRIQKLTAKSKEKFKTVKDDTIDLRRQIMPSLFTGNFYSESSGWETTPGFVIIENNGHGKPNVFDFSL
jgi:hypothetical protein